MESMTFHSNCGLFRITMSNQLGSEGASFEKMRIQHYEIRMGTEERMLIL